jgi:transposase-like protein
VNTSEQTVSMVRRRRRRHSAAFKAEAVAACLQPGVSIAAAALSRGLNANLLRRWVVDAERTGELPAKEGTTKDECKIAVNIGELQTAQDLYQIVNLASDGGSTRFKVLLHTQTCKERHDHTRQVIPSQLRGNESHPRLPNLRSAGYPVVAETLTN